MLIFLVGLAAAVKTLLKFIISCSNFDLSVKTAAGWIISDMQESNNHLISAGAGGAD